MKKNTYKNNKLNRNKTEKAKPNKNIKDKNKNSINNDNLDVNHFDKNNTKTKNASVVVDDTVNTKIYKNKTNIETSNEANTKFSNKINKHRKKRLIYTFVFFFALFVIFGSVFVFYQVECPLKYKGYINKYAYQYDLSPQLVASVINEESGFNKDAVSSVGAIGLMQIMPSTGEYISQLLNEDYKYKMLFEPETNIRYGCFYLNYLKTKFKDEKTVLCAYNAGESTVMSWLKNDSLSSDGKTLTKIPYNATAKYVKEIVKHKRYYLVKI